MTISRTADHRLEDSLDEARSKVSSVLAYFERFERAARLENHRPEYIHWEECWLLLHNTFYGRFRLPVFVRPVTDMPVVQQAEMPKKRTKCCLEVQSRPMRRVTKVRASQGIWHVELECGHTREQFHAPGKQGRCKQCRPAMRKPVRAAVEDAITRSDIKEMAKLRKR